MAPRDNSSENYREEMTWTSDYANSGFEAGIMNSPVLITSGSSIQFDLIELCKTGDPRAQLQIYKLLYKVMYNISLRIVKDPETAEDVMQESFLVAFERIRAFSGRASFITWLKKLVEDMSIETWRKNNIA